MKKQKPKMYADPIEPKPIKIGKLEDWAKIIKNNKIKENSNESK